MYIGGALWILSQPGRTGQIGNVTNKMETTIIYRVIKGLYRVCTGIMEKKMETTIVYSTNPWGLEELKVASRPVAPSQGLNPLGFPYISITGT